MRSLIDIIEKTINSKHNFINKPMENLQGFHTLKLKQNLEG